MYWNRFDIVEAYYCYLSEHHEGQYSDKYARLCRILTYFKPKPNLCYDKLDENGKYIYTELVHNYKK